MTINRTSIPRLVLITLLAMLSCSIRNLQADNGTCNGVGITLPFNDVASNVFFCQIAEAYFSGLTNGTSATTYSPHDTVPREQMAAFITRTMDQSIKRSSPRATLGQWWTTQNIVPTSLTSVGALPMGVQSDGQSLWVANHSSASVSRVRASDGRVIETWTGMSAPRQILIADGRVYVAGGEIPGKLYVINPSQPAGNATALADVCDDPTGLAYDGEHILVAGSGGVTIYHVPSGIKITYTNNFSSPQGAIYDGSSFWITDFSDNQLKKVHVSGQILQTVDVGSHPGFPTFDGTNIWAPNAGDGSITVLRASTGAVVATLTGNGLGTETNAAAFDGERIAVTNSFSDSISVWRATDLAPLGSYSTGANSLPSAVCTDGRNFWIALQNAGKLARF